MNKRKKKILSMNLDEISLVKSGDDPSALVVISKAAPSDEKSTNNQADASTMSATTTSEDEDMADSDISKDDATATLTDEDYIAGLEGLVEDAIEAGYLTEDGEIVDSADEGDEDEDDDEAPEAEVEKSLDSIMKSNPLVAEAIKKANDRAANAESIAKAERDARIEREMVSKAAALNFVPGSPEDMKDLLSESYGVSDAHGERVEKALRRANAALREGEIFKEAGNGLAVGDTVETLAAEIRKSDSSLTPEQAIVRVYEENPDLYLTEGA
jgi:hypothetical protein